MRQFSEQYVSTFKYTKFIWLFIASWQIFRKLKCLWNELVNCIDIEVHVPSIKYSENRIVVLHICNLFYFLKIINTVLINIFIFKLKALNFCIMYNVYIFKSWANLQNMKTAKNHIPRFKEIRKVSAACLMFLNWKTYSKGSEKHL